MQQLPKNELLEEANKELREQPWWERDMKFVDAESQGFILVLRAEGMQGGDELQKLKNFDEFGKNFAKRFCLL